MTLAGMSFWFWRFCEINTLIPTLGMMAYFVHAYISVNVLTPDFILLLFITSVLAAAWAIATIISYSRARHSGFFVAVVDLCFVGCFIASVYLLRGIVHTDCNNFTASHFFQDVLGIMGAPGYSLGYKYAVHPTKNCSMLKASFAFGIMNCIFFFITALLAMAVGRHYEKKDRVIIEKRTHRRRSSHHSSRSPRRSHHSSHRHGYV